MEKVKKGDGLVCLCWGVGEGEGETGWCYNEKVTRHLNQKIIRDDILKVVRKMV